VSPGAGALRANDRLQRHDPVLTGQPVRRI
jgi:hypothetical protein